MKKRKRKKKYAHMKIHNALRKTEKSDCKEGKSETNYTSSQVPQRERAIMGKL